MYSSEYNAVNGLFVFHLDIAMLKISIFLISGLSDNNIDDFTKLLEVLNDLRPTNSIVKLVDEYLIVMVVSADVDSTVADFYCFQLIELGGYVNACIPISDSI